MMRSKVGRILIALLLALICLPIGSVSASGTDEIKIYTIDVLPQDDGSLINTYLVKWCVISDSAGPLTWFTVGMPNDQFEILTYGGDVTSASVDNSGFTYSVRFDLSRAVNAGDCVSASVQVHQYGLGQLDKSTNQVTYQFTPGWFDEVPVDMLQVTWHLPTDAAQVKSLSPTPASQSSGQAVWETPLQPGEKYKITIVYDEAAFTNFNPDLTVATTSAGSQLPTNPSNTGTNGYTNTGFALPFSNMSPVCLCLVILFVLLVLFLIFRAMNRAGRAYRGGGYFGGYPRGGGWIGGGGFGSGGGGGIDIPSRSGGGSGEFGGRGMSCACVSSGCACACAGGGRAGCSRKGFDVSGLFDAGGHKERS